MSIIRQVDFHESFDGIHLGNVRVTNWSNLSPSVNPKHEQFKNSFVIDLVEGLSC